MRMRHALTGLTLGSALALGGTAVAAHAAEPARSAEASARETNAVPSEKHHHGTYWTLAQCQAAGASQSLPYTCEPFIFGAPTVQWALYLRY
ncbi:hypothetical protein ABZZ17_14360 [Streptomyces sp. NPDC006512]|uniref:hypothetical protein n=1 Tax=Streptomyces sp. NPDC006512 TaxID=3154307 RepID=UPI0033B4009E